MTTDIPGSSSLPLYNEAGEEIEESSVDTSKGYIKNDKKFIAHHDAEPAVVEEYHYRVKNIVFDDGTIMYFHDDEKNINNEPDGDNTDPHIQVQDDQKGQFVYVDQGEGKSYRGMEVEKIIDVEKADAKDPYDEYKDIRVYVLYTEDELKQRKEDEEKAKKQQDFMENGPDQLQSNTDSIDDLYITMADLVAGSEE